MFSGLASHPTMLFFFLMIRRPPRSTLFPYTDALPICPPGRLAILGNAAGTTARAYGHYFPRTAVDGVEIDGKLTEIGRRDRKSTRLNSSHANISYAVFCLKKKQHTQP